MSENNATVEAEKAKEQLSLNEINQTMSTPVLSNTESKMSALTPTNQQIPFLPPQITTFQNPSIPTFHVLNSEYSPQQQSSTSETIKPYVLTPQVTDIPSFMSQESTMVTTSQEPSKTSVSLSQSATTQELNNQPSNVFPQQNNYSQYHPTDIGGTTTVAEPSSQDISHYFTQFQTQVTQSNSSSSIPMFSVKNFPQMSPLAQPLGI